MRYSALLDFAGFYFPNFEVSIYIANSRILILMKKSIIVFLKYKILLGSFLKTYLQKSEV